MTNTVFREAFFLAISEYNKKAAGITTIALLGVLILLFLIGSMIYHKKQKHKDAVAVVETFGALFYIYGDNIGYILDRYGETFHSGYVEFNRTAAIITLGISLLLFQLLPAWIESFAKYTRRTETKLNFISYLFLMLTIIPKTDGLFTVVEEKARTGNFCSTPDIYVTAGFYGACVVVSSFIIITYCILAYREAKKYAILTAFLCWLCLPLYMLADNLQPLDCALGCNTMAPNATRNDRCHKSSISRLTLIVLTLIFLGPSMIVILIKDNRPQVERPQQCIRYQRSTSGEESVSFPNLDDATSTTGSS